MGEIIKGPWGDEKPKTKPTAIDENKAGRVVIFPSGQTPEEFTMDRVSVDNMFAHVDPEIQAHYDIVRKRVKNLLDKLGAHDSVEIKHIRSSLHNAIAGLEEVYNDYVFPDDNILSDFTIKYAGTTPEHSLKNWIKHIEEYLNANGV